MTKRYMLAAVTALGVCWALLVTLRVYAPGEPPAPLLPASADGGDAGASRRLGSPNPVPACVVARTVLTCNGQGTANSWQAGGGSGGGFASNVYQTTVSCATKSGIGGTVSVVGGIDGSAASIAAGIDGGVICVVPLPAYPPTSDAASFVGIFDTDFEVLSHLANGPATAANWIGGRYNLIGLYSDAGLVTGSNFQTPTNGYSGSNPALLGFTWANTGGFDASAGSGNNALQSIQFVPSASDSGVSLYMGGWNYAGISDASTWDWTVTYTVTYSAN